MSKRARKHKPPHPPGPAGQLSLGPDGLHARLPGPPPSPAELDALSQTFQAILRNSQLWDQLVAQYGLAQAERLLGQCRVQLGPGGHSHGGNPPGSGPDP